jgi:uncharacterized protein
MLGLGWFAVGLAVLGVFLPLLPTTPFLLVAAWAFGRSSERLRLWLYESRLFGPLLQNWQKHGAIPIWAKVMAVTAMAAAFYGLSQRETIPDWALALTGVILLTVAVWITTRPSEPKKA